MLSAVSGEDVSLRAAKLNPPPKRRVGAAACIQNLTRYNVSEAGARKSDRLGGVFQKPSCGLSEHAPASNEKEDRLISATASR